MQSFLYRDLDGLINIDTLSPSGNYYYKVQKPISINMANFACKIVFYNIDGSLIYYRKEALAHWLEPSKNIEVVKWSSEGNLVYFYEYKRNAIYDSVFLHLKDKYCFRIDELKNNVEIVKSLHLQDRKFNEEEVINKLQAKGLERQELIKDELSEENFFNKLLHHSKWHPSI